MEGVPPAAMSTNAAIVWNLPSRPQGEIEDLMIKERMINRPDGLVNHFEGIPRGSVAKISAKYAHRYRYFMLSSDFYQQSSSDSNAA